MRDIDAIIAVVVDQRNNTGYDSKYAYYLSTQNSIYCMLIERKIKFIYLMLKKQCFYGYKVLNPKTGSIRKIKSWFHLFQSMWLNNSFFVNGFCF